MTFGKETITLGSAPHNDIVLTHPGVAPVHAHIERRGSELVFVDHGAGPTHAQGTPVPAGSELPFDFRTEFFLGGAPLPLSHPALVSMLLAKGTAPAPQGTLLVGREPSRASVVILHPAVSGLHATLALDRMMVIDHSSTSGTYVGGRPTPPNTPVPLDPNGVVAFGPVPVPVSLLMHLAHAMAQGHMPAAPAIGAPLAATMRREPHASMPPPGSVVAHASGPSVPPQAAPRKHRTVIGELSMDAASAAVISIGRTPENQIVVPHPQVSSRHAAIHTQGGQLFLEDRGSANGTYVRGQRLAPGQRVPVQHGEKVFIGPMPLLIQIAGSRVDVAIEDQANWSGKPLYEIEAWDLFLEVPDRDRKGSMKTLLDHVSFKALPGDMIALMGPSGAGKTTLLLALNGYLPPTSGQVRINGEDLYSIYDALRGSIGYVPQDDLVHPELTVFEAVKYSARFRLPPDYSDKEINERVEQTLRDLGLEGVKGLQIGKPEKKVLSGGQRKRVNIALELVTDPVILFLDEPTSGLAADDTTALITLLSDLTRKTGKTIIMTIHQPAKDEFEKFNLAFIMGYGGIPTFFGPAGEPAYQFFGSLRERISSTGRNVDNPRDMFDMLHQRERAVLEDMKRQHPNPERNWARLEAAKGWRAEFFRPENPVYAQMFSGRRQIGAPASGTAVPKRASVALIRQFGLLLSRYWKIKTRDVAGAAIMFLQAPIIGLLLVAVFGGQKEAVPYWCLGALQELSAKHAMNASATSNLLNEMKPTTDHTVALFFVVVSSVWFGTSNAAREIVTERAIYLRERMVNLSLVNYVLSKYFLLTLFCIVQCTTLLAVVFFSLGFQGGPLAFVMELMSMIAVSMNAAALGLLLSTVVSSAEAAMALTPIALIPQVVLGGLMVPMTTNPPLRYLMLLMPARWGFQGSVTWERQALADSPAWLIDLHKPDLSSASDYVTQGKFQCAIAQMASDHMSGAWGFSDWESVWLPPAVLFGMTGVMLVVLLVLLRKRDPV